jgi:hypothetical protein
MAVIPEQNRPVDLAIDGHRNVLVTFLNSCGLEVGKAVLEVDNVKVHKVPVQEDGVWTQVPRYTFDGMDFDVTN